MRNKQNEIKTEGIDKLSAQNLENLFYVFQNDKGQYFYNINKTVNFPEDLDPTLYFQYETKPKDTWTTISYEYYGDIRLWWVICSANQILDPTKHPEPGTILKVILPDIIRNILTQLKDG